MTSDAPKFSPRLFGSRSTALGQAYPTKPIRIVIPFGPGGVADITARTVAPEISKGLGQQLVIENKPSAGGAVAGQDVARSAPDGYTLLLINNGTAVSKALFKSLPYDPERDFEMISTIGFFPMVIMTDAKSGLKSVQDLVAEARKNPGKLNAGTIGIGSTGGLSPATWRHSGSPAAAAAACRAAIETATTAFPPNRAFCDVPSSSMRRASMAR